MRKPKTRPPTMFKAPETVEIEGVEFGPSLEAKEVFFAQRYAECGNPAVAYCETQGRKATKTDHYSGTKFLGRPNVQAELRRYRMLMRERYVLNETEIVRHMEMIAQADLAELYGDDGRMLHPSQWPDAIRQSVQSIKVTQVKGRDAKGDDLPPDEIIEVKFWSKTAALDQLARKAGLYEKDNLQKAPTIVHGLDAKALEALRDGLRAAVAGAESVHPESDAPAAGRTTH
jgi:hypothetical protein